MSIIELSSEQMKRVQFNEEYAYKLIPWETREKNHTIRGSFDVQCSSKVFNWVENLPKPNKDWWLLTLKHGLLTSTKISQLVIRLSKTN